MYLSRFDCFLLLQVCLWVAFVSVFHKPIASASDFVLRKCKRQLLGRRVKCPSCYGSLRIKKSHRKKCPSCGVELKC